MLTSMPRQTDLIGRTKDKESILRALNDGKTVIISGIGGIGKTSLAVEVGRTWQTTTADSKVAWITANDEASGGGQTLSSFDGFVNAVARGLGRPGLDSMVVEKKLPHIIKRLSAGRFLVVIDSLELIGANREDILNFVAGIPEPSVCIVTTRELPPAKWLERQQTIWIHRLHGMTRDETRELVKSRANHSCVSLESISDTQFDTFYTAVGGHPLLIRWIASQLSFGYSLTAVLDQIADSDIEQKLGMIFSLSYDHLDEQAKRVLQALTVFGAPAHKNALAYVTGLPRRGTEPTLDQVIAQLVSSSLIDVDDDAVENRRCSIHPLVRQFAGIQMRKSPGAQDKFHLREIGWLIGRAVDLSTQAGVDEYAGIRQDIPNIVSVAEWCKQNDYNDKLIELVDATHHLVWELGYRAEEFRLCKLGFEASLVEREYRTAWRMAYSLGWSEYRRANYEAAEAWANEVERILSMHAFVSVSPSVVGDLRAHVLLRRQESQARKLEKANRQVEAQETRYLAYREARALMERSLAAFQQSGDHMNTAFSKTHLGELELARGNYADAEKWFKEILADVEISIPKNILAWTWGNLGDVCFAKGDSISAHEYYLSGLNLARQISRDTTIAHCMKGLARNAMQNELHEDAKKWLQDALKIYQAQHHQQRIQEVQQYLDDIEKRPQPTPPPVTSSSRSEAGWVIFKLQLTHLAGLQFGARALATSMGEPHATSRLPFSAADLSAVLQLLEYSGYDPADFDYGQSEALQRLGLVRGGQLAHDHLKRIGQGLYEALFPGDVGMAFRVAFNQARQARQTVFLQLRFDSDAVELARYPWELLHDGQRHLVSAGAVEMTRYITYGEAAPSLPVEPPTRLLFVESRPKDLTTLPQESERLAVWNSLQALTGNGKVALERLDPPTYHTLLGRIVSADCHLIHFDGHGLFARRCPRCRAMNYLHLTACYSCQLPLDNVSPQGYLAFEDGRGKADFVSTEDMENMLLNRQVRLMFLSACQTGVVRGASLFGGLGSGLIRAGVPAVVAMQFSVPVQATISFAESFYKALARGETVSRAVAQGRLCLFRNHTWFIPTLYLRSQDDEGHIFTA